jgi:hypothetical protein
MEQIVMTDRFKMHENGGLTLSAFVMDQLKWEPGNCDVEQYMDVSNGRLILIRKGSGLQGWVKDIEGIYPLFRSCPISVRGYVTINKVARDKFGWGQGMDFKQILDTEIQGIIIEKQEESHG